LETKVEEKRRRKRTLGLFDVFFLSGEGIWILSDVVGDNWRGGIR
jgi:hypothetical protein